MKFSATAVLASIGLVSAQFQGVPDCGVKCLTAAIERLGCDVNTPSCSCTEVNQAKMASDLTMVGCLTMGCNADQLADVISAGTKICSQVSASAALGPSSTGVAAPSGASASGSALSTGAASANGDDESINAAGTLTYSLGVSVMAALAGIYQLI